MNQLLFIAVLALFVCTSLAADTEVSPVTASATFVTTTEKVKLGSNFLAKCTISVVPNTNYNVTFYLKQYPLGQYVVKSKFGLISFGFGSLANYSLSVADGTGFKSTWETINFAPGLNVFKTVNSTHPNYAAIYEPKTVQALGTYKCSITVEVPSGGHALYYSNEYDANDISGVPSVVPTVKITYHNEPAVEALKVGQNFIGKCTLDMMPKEMSYNVTIIFNHNIYVYYQVRGK